MKTLEQRIADLEEKVAELEKQAAAGTTAEINIMATGTVSVPPEEFKAILDAAPVVDLKKASNLKDQGEPLKPASFSKGVF